MINISKLVIIISLVLSGSLVHARPSMIKNISVSSNCSLRFYKGKVPEPEIFGRGIDSNVQAREAFLKVYWAVEELPLEGSSKSFEFPQFYNDKKDSIVLFCGSGLHAICEKGLVQKKLEFDAIIAVSELKKGRPGHHKIEQFSCEVSFGPNLKSKTLNIQ